MANIPGKTYVDGIKARSTHTGTQSADTLTDGTTNKAFLATERTKLSGIATGATANSSDSTLENRANHTGSQAISTITGLQALLDSLQAQIDDLQNQINNDLANAIIVVWNGTAWPLARPTSDTGYVVIADGGTAAPTWLLAGDIWLEDA